MQVLRCWNDTYLRQDGVWRYCWGEPVPGAVDLTLADLWRSGIAVDGLEEIDALRRLTGAERRWLAGEADPATEVFLRRRSGYRPHVGDLIVGLSAPELQAPTMMTVADVAAAAGVSKATIDSYRYRGYLPEPQVVCGRTPLWARPIVRHWLAARPGPGWRTDVHEPDGRERSDALVVA